MGSSIDKRMRDSQEDANKDYTQTSAYKQLNGINTDTPYSGRNMSGEEVRRRLLHRAHVSQERQIRSYKHSILGSGDFRENYNTQTEIIKKRRESIKKARQERLEKMNRQNSRRDRARRGVKGKNDDYHKSDKSKDPEGPKDADLKQDIGSNYSFQEPERKAYNPYE